MGIKAFKPTSPGRRQMTVLTNDELTTETPAKRLLEGLKRSGGRNNQGRLSVRHRGGGHKRRYRLVDFKRNKPGVPARVATIEYDPNRSGRLALLHYADGDKRYILAPGGLCIGDTLLSGPDAEVKVGNALPLMSMPTGTMIHNVELRPGKGAQLIRSAGASAQVMGKEGAYVQIRLKSGEVRRVLGACLATVGQVGNPDHENVSVGKAGRMRWKGQRPHVRGVAMNPVDHPHGGGEGKAAAGNPHPVSPWGQQAKGYKTRRTKRTDQFIVAKRKK